MCGIIGYNGKNRNVIKILLNGLKNLEYRGYDSAGVAYLNNDEIVGIFPEGTRNKDCESLLPFKFGAVKMAKVTGKKIVPCVITGSYKIFSRNLKVRFGKAIDIKSMSLEDANEFLRNTMLKMLEEK